MEQKTIALIYAQINTNYTHRISASKLRGYLGHLFVQDVEFHHHDDKPYHYPLVQYKTIRGKLFVIGINEYANVVLQKISGIHEIVLPNTKAAVSSVEITSIKETPTNKICQYEFLTPWIGLNTENYAKFKNIDDQFKKRFLEDILIGNILSMLKGVGIRIDYQIYINLKKYKEVPVRVHEHQFSGFFAQFVSNITLPKYIGIGKSVSKGFGVLEKTC